MEKIKTNRMKIKEEFRIRCRRSTCEARNEGHQVKTKQGRLQKPTCDEDGPTIAASGNFAFRLELMRDILHAKAALDMQILKVRLLFERHHVRMPPNTPN